jgi:ssDNA-binding Zn-finger/Zn-ribbon topoisomerase 1
MAAPVRAENEFPEARDDLVCAECGARMVLRKSKFGPFYGCTKFPECRGAHGAHQTGKPKGKPGDTATKKARIEAHTLFDRIWKEKLVKNRGAAYKWMQKALKLPKSQAHIGEFSEEQCRQLMKAVYEAFPKVRAGRYTALLVDPLGD